MTKNNKIVIKDMKIKNMKHNYFLGEYSAIVNLINTKIDENQYLRIQPKLNQISYLTAIEINKFCKKNNIKLIFVGLDKESKNLLNRLKLEGVNVAYLPVDISKSTNNCAPIDPNQPNAKVHKHYANIIYIELKKINLI